MPLTLTTNVQPDDTHQQPVENAVQTEIEAAGWLAAIIDSADDAIISKTLDGVLTSWNKGAQRMFGYTAEEAIGKSVLMLIPPARHGEEAEVLGALRRGDKIENYETVRLNKSGEPLHISLTVSPIHNSDGTIVGASKIARDITQRKLTEALLQQALQQSEEAKAEAERANRLKDEFLAIVSHELRTPLTAILGWSAMLQNHGLDPDETNRALQTIWRNAKTQSQLIDDLLDVSRIVSGKMRLTFDTVDTADIVQAAVDTVLPSSVEAEVKIDVNIDDSIGTITGDGHRLQQVVWNLLTNAVKFTPPGGRIVVDVTRCITPEGAKLQVTDTGEGIEPSFLPYVFQRFAQENSSSTRAHGGLGMGLAIAKYIVEQHGGSIHAHSDGPGRGAQFTVLLPRVAEVPVHDVG